MIVLNYKITSIYTITPKVYFWYYLYNIVCHQIGLV